MNHITLDQANKVIEGAFAKAKELHLKPLGVVVLDAGGHSIAFQRQDGASTGRLQIATGKAAGALFLGLSSRKVGALAADRPTLLAPIGPISPPGVVPAAGGGIVVDTEGLPTGAEGMSWHQPDQAQMCP